MVLFFFLMIVVLLRSDSATGRLRRKRSRRNWVSAVLPLVKWYCLECHSAEEQEGDLDLERFTKLEQVRNAPRVWQPRRRDAR